ncbi:hypothetical protein Ae201684P_021098 [Aphanomyces euteiches]|uniref:Uncharacterized protein n=1 Tax=Aphanomyces euteiches TaxID=100861 RepID=A0A6G0WH42_9STRA|nr:hypothetical protein Ae201684_015281 [Aphanomyces euteiches]KAH9071961.1 hypothetical protein Ae201684P_021098 [Aphanomyces euteiches]KAH9143990.1 hypothetical protein AeRB84_012049 [Aphanomyces euteiches]
MKANLTTIFATKTFEGLQWLLKVWSNLLPSTWMSRCRRECRTLALQFEAWDIVEVLTKDERSPAAKYDQDLIHATKLALLDAVEWLLTSTDVVVKCHHIVEASKCFRRDNLFSSLILERLLGEWLPTATDVDTKMDGLDLCINEAFKRGYLRAVQIIWSMAASKHDNDMESPAR